MAHIDIFNNDAFGITSMSDALDKVEFQPHFLGSLGVFSPTPIRTKTVGVEERDGVLSLVPASERGAPIEEGGRERRKLRYFETIRIAKGTTLYADEIQSIRAFGSENEMQAVQAEVARKYNGPTGILSDIELTFEHMRLGALQGVVLDADGSTELVNWYKEWGISKPPEINFSLGTAGTDIRKLCADVVRTMARAGKGAFTPGTQIHALAGDTFYDKLIGHPTVRETYLNQAAASELRTAQVTNGQNGSFGSFTYAGITFHNYRGMDDQSRVTVDSGKAKFFPIGAPGVFQHVMSPAEFMPYVNTPGRKVYGMTVVDRDREAWVRPEAYAYPLFMCTRPELLLSADDGIK